MLKSVPSVVGYYKAGTFIHSVILLKAHPLHGHRGVHPGQVASSSQG